MDVGYFLRLRTAFIRRHYDIAAGAFERLKEQIEAHEPPFDDPPFSEDPEPPFLNEWLEADASVQFVGRACVSLLSDAVKLYFNMLPRQFDFSLLPAEEAKIRKLGFVPVFRDVLSKVFSVDWETEGIAFEVIEQIVLTRNRTAHGSNLTTDHVGHDAQSLSKHPEPLFASEREIGQWVEMGSPPNAFMMPAVEITRARLMAAIGEVERLSYWLDDNAHRADEWRERQRSSEAPITL